jgi:hypothetical protein
VGPVSMVERGILLFGQRKISIPSAQASALEKSLQSHLTVGAQHGRQQLRVISPRSNWRRVGRHGLSSTVGGAIASHWSITARLKPGSPRSVRC